uniref:WRC domain-containing protein n=1 Tax=viral metagenome TaxID=1070528 RepID=A0A6C0F0F4_9ZZZZ
MSRKSPLTIDDILGPNIEPSEVSSPKPIQTSNPKLISKGKSKAKSISISIPNTESSNEANTESNSNPNPNLNPNTSSPVQETNIDYILNNGLVKFDNKNQSSMFFVCYKALNAFCLEMKTKYNVNIPKEFIDKQIITIIPPIIKEYTGNLKKRCKKAINIETICLGRKLDGKQCTRKKHIDSDFCKSHLIKLSNGRIDQDNNTKICNKRGRKRKVEFDPRQYDNEYITLWEDIINGQKVLIDSNSNIYTYDLKAPRYIGKKTVNTKLDLSVLEPIPATATVPSITPATTPEQITETGINLILEQPTLEQPTLEEPIQELTTPEPKQKSKSIIKKIELKNKKVISKL